MAKTWLITGSSRGFGRDLAEAVLVAGHNLVATARATRERLPISTWVTGIERSPSRST